MIMVKMTIMIMMRMVLMMIYMYIQMLLAADDEVARLNMSLPSKTLRVVLY